jgi:hypothetical protein
MRRRHAYEAACLRVDKIAVKPAPDEIGCVLVASIDATLSGVSAPL